jgi:hypothetical protein
MCPDVSTPGRQGDVDQPDGDVKKRFLVVIDAVS